MDTRAIIEVEGLDAKQFLNSITTNTVPTEVNSCVSSLILTPNGRFLFEFFLYYLNDEVYLIDIDKNETTNLVALLNKYLIRSKVNIKISEDMFVLYSRFPVFEDVTNSDTGYAYIRERDIYSETTSKSNPFVRDTMKPILFTRDPRFYKMGYRFVFNRKDFLDESVVIKSRQEYLEDKYLFSIPDNIDLIANKSIPNEYGLDKLNAINYKKGCYIGQELVNRIKTQGVIRKKLFKVRFIGITEENDIDNAVRSLVPVLQNKKEIGVLCSTYKKLGIAIIRMDKYNTDAQNLYTTTDGRVIELHNIDWS